MLAKLFNSQTKSIGGATGILAISSIVSGFLGLLTDRLLASRFGAGLETSIFFAAFKIPDFVYNILISGGVLVSFLPIFSAYFVKKEEEAWRMVNYVLHVFSFLLVIIALVLFVLAPFLVELITPGFVAEGKTLVVLLTRLLLLQPILLGLSNIFSGVLQYFNKFLIYSLAPIFYNLGIITGILFLAPYFGVLGIGLGVLLGAFLHLAIQVPFVIKCGFRYKFLFDFKYPAIKQMFRLMLPRIFAISVNQVNTIVITAIASTITVGSIAIFNFSNALRSFPITILGISLATVVFPTFSKLWVNGQKQEFRVKFSLIFRQVVFLIVPVMVLMYLLRAQIVRLILGTGQFGWQETRLTAACLGLFVFSLFASTLIPLLIRIFFSFQDTKTPTIVAFITTGLGIGLSFILKSLLSSFNWFSELVFSFLKLSGLTGAEVIALPLAISLSAIVQFILLLFFLHKKVGGFAFKEMVKSFKKVLLAGGVMTVVSYFSIGFLAFWVNMQTFIGILLQTGFTALIGLVVYFFVAWILKSVEVKMICATISVPLKKLFK